jgi:hypothetical protein
MPFRKLGTGLKRFDSSPVSRQYAHTPFGFTQFSVPIARYCHYTLMDIHDHRCAGRETIPVVTHRSLADVLLGNMDEVAAFLRP